MAASKDAPGNQFVMGYYTLRLTVGALGMLLPFALWLGGLSIFGTDLQPTISDYHGTGMRDVFVGILVSLGVFLMVYLGKDWRENWATNCAGACAVAVAWFSNQPPTKPVHFLAAGLFFTTLACIALFLWPRPEDGSPITLQKRRRNWLYRGSGIGILACLAGIVVVSVQQGGLPEAAAPGSAVFWLETAAVELFGFGWLVKGRVLKHLHLRAFVEPADAQQPAPPASLDV